LKFIFSYDTKMTPAAWVREATLACWV